MSIARRQVARPGDEYSCGGCGQHLVFDARGFVPDHQLRACESRCDWTLLRRLGTSVPS